MSVSVIDSISTYKEIRIHIILDLFIFIRNILTFHMDNFALHYSNLSNYQKINIALVNISFDVKWFSVSRFSSLWNMNVHQLDNPAVHVSVGALSTLFTAKCNSFSFMVLVVL